MVRNMSKVLLVLAVLSSAASLSAKSYAFGSLGLQFDLGQLGGTITKDGLDAANYYPVTATNGQPGTASRRAIIAENRLQTLENTTVGLINVKANGAMSGLVLSAGYEHEFGKYFFARVAANYTRKIMGGDTEAKALGFKFYDITWDYNAVQIPVNVGIKVSVTEDAAFYIGAGVHYFKGGWSLAGSSLSGLVHDQMVTLGVPTTISNLLADGTSPPAIWENTRFSVSGVAPNWLVGAQARVTEKGHVFLEAETLFSYKLGTGHTQSLGGISSLAPSPSYPIVLGGTQYRVGYKHEL
ncbi:porin OmpL1 [Leptospira gomenensis]|uniref:Porin OmpL1 n=1 Tax=Leptospira gomenensis TaxID=2484974 RepID=A0A5F1YI77_9LEPT|nr:porin OmpL1 [Leptospira gomenensis]TGK34541.1 porin OmpL1 [Leptospira gomenensis]TGK40149.1 porin OmpL1 [Leptospira gomenensis]TGK42678.1 porin OmpL1 [Leptospira gomenensis]TGK55658.1 porin OmpL1 [Leptospira gomenensis]